MIKVSVFRLEKTTKIVVESRDDDTASVDDLDVIYRIINSQEPKRSGFINSTSFSVEVLNDE